MPTAYGRRWTDECVEGTTNVEYCPLGTPFGNVGWRPAEGWCGKDEVEPLQVSLLELVEAVSDVASGENEVIATVAHMIRSGSVVLDGMGSDDGLADLLTAVG